MGRVSGNASESQRRLASSEPRQPTRRRASLGLDRKTEDQRGEAKSLPQESMAASGEGSRWVVGRSRRQAADLPVKRQQTVGMPVCKTHCQFAACALPLLRCGGAQTNCQGPDACQRRGRPTCLSWDVARAAKSMRRVQRSLFALVPSSRHRGRCRFVARALRNGWERCELPDGNEFSCGVPLSNVGLVFLPLAIVQVLKTPDVFQRFEGDSGSPVSEAVAPVPTT